MAEAAAHEISIRIHIDRKPYEVHEREMTGAQLRAVPTPPIAANFDLWQEEHGDVEDQQVPENTPIKPKEDMHFYSSPNNINPGAC